MTTRLDASGSPAPKVVFVCAFAAEARPLIERYRLRGVESRSPWPLYRENESGDYALIVGGMGRLSTAAAVSYAACAWSAAANTVWVNVGVAGHATLELGTPRLCHRVRGPRGSWYPPRVFDSAIPGAPLLTGDEPVTDYPDDTLVDMEGSAFIETAWRFSSAELVQLIKIVADNRSRPAGKPDPVAATRWIADALPEVEPIVDSLRELAEEIAYEPRFDIEPFLAHWHFSSTRTHELRELLRRWQALAIEEHPWTVVQGATEAADAMDRLRARLQASRLTFIAASSATSRAADRGSGSA